MYKLKVLCLPQAISLGVEQDSLARLNNVRFALFGHITVKDARRFQSSKASPL